MLIKNVFNNNPSSKSPRELLEDLKKSYTKFDQTNSLSTKRFPKKLYTEGLDNEQIWQQLEIFSNEILTSLPTPPNDSLFVTKVNKPPVEEDLSSVDEIIQNSTIGANLSENDEFDNILSNQALSEEEENPSQDETEDENDFENFEKEAEAGLSSEDEDLLYDTHIGDDVVSEESEEEMTSFQKQQKDMSDKIEKLEEKSLQPKNWQMTGEVTASSRPLNSLVDENLNFEYSAVPPPPVTLESNKTLEEMILERIKNKIFDDVERKVKPVDKPYEYKKESMIDQEKSKKSLVEVYEESRAKSNNLSKSESDKKLAKVHNEIRSSLNSLIEKLNIMSSFHFSPANARPDAVIVNNMEALYAEEKIPTIASTRADILAPEEITNKRKSGVVVGKDERSETDRKRERRKKKLLQHYRQKPNKKEIVVHKKSVVDLGNEKTLRSSAALFSSLENDKRIEAVKRKSKVKDTKKQSASKKFKL